MDKKQEVFDKNVSTLRDMIKELKISQDDGDVQQLVINVAVAMDNLYFNHYTGYIDSLDLGTL